MSSPGPCDTGAACCNPHVDHTADECTTAEMHEAEWLEAKLDEAFETIQEATKHDTEPVSMITEGSRARHDLSIVVLRGAQTIEMFRQWAERNGILTRG